MLPMFLILLVSAFVSLLIYLRASHEIPRILAAGSAIFCSIWAFAMAPWPIQLLVVFLIFRLEWVYPFTKLGEVTLTISPYRRK
jgi:hypothetical protein